MSMYEDTSQQLQVSTTSLTWIATGLPVVRLFFDLSGRWDFVFGVEPELRNRTRRRFARFGILVFDLEWSGSTWWTSRNKCKREPGFIMIFIVCGRSVHRDVVSRVELELRNRTRRSYAGLVFSFLTRSLLDQLDGHRAIIPIQ